MAVEGCAEDGGRRGELKGQGVARGAGSVVTWAFHYGVPGDQAHGVRGFVGAYH